MIVFAKARLGADLAPGRASPKSREDLKERFLRQDEFETFYAETAPGLRSFLYRMVQSRELAEDLLQESYLRCLNRPMQVEETARMKSFVYRIASNLAVDRWRKKRREKGWLALLASRETPVDPGADPRLRLSIEQGLEYLKPKERALIWLAYVEGYAHREIAEILDLRAASVRVMLFRARKKLEDVLRPQHGRGSQDA